MAFEIQQEKGIKKDIGRCDNFKFTLSLHIWKPVYLVNTTNDVKYMEKKSYVLGCHMPFKIYSILLRLHGNCLRKTFFQCFLNLLQCNLFRNSSNFPFLDCSRLFLSYFYSVEYCEQPRDRCYGSKSSDIGATCLGYYLISLQL